MSYNFQTITNKDFGKGINAKSSPNDLDVGYSERLTNVDIYNKSMTKRQGYQGFGGWLPLRVLEAQHTAGSGGVGELKLFFDANVSFVNAGVRPVVVYGHLSNATSVSGAAVEFVKASDTGHYYSTFAGSIPYTFSAPSGTGTGFNPGSSDDLFLMTQRNTLAGSASSSWFWADDYNIDSTVPYDASIDWSGLASDIDVFVSSFEVTGVSGEELVYTYTETGSPEIIDISALDTVIPILQFYLDNAGVWEQFIPDTVVLDQSTPVLTVTTSLPVATSIKALMLSPAPTDITSVTVPYTTGIVTITSDYDFFAFTCYDNTNAMIIPDDVSYDSVAGEITLTFSSLLTDTSMIIVLAPMGVQANFITLPTPGDTSVYTDTSPQLTVWGFNQDDLYDSSTPNGAKVMHIDSYKREGEARLMAGINGVLMKAATYDEAATSYKFGATQVVLDTRNSSSVSIGPAFAATGATAARTAGLLRADNISSTNYALVTSVEYVSSGVARYYLALTNKSGTLSGCINSSYDYLTTTGCARSIHNGTFAIISVDDTDNYIEVTNALMTSARYNESGMLARAAVFTDKFTSNSPTSALLDGDMVSISSNSSFECGGHNDYTVLLKGVTAYYTIALSSKVYGSRTSALVPVGVATNFVRGDMLSVTGIARQPRVLYINPTNTTSNPCSFAGDGTTTTVTMTNDTDFVVGMSVILISTDYPGINGEYVITETVTSKIFKFLSSYNDSGDTGFIVGPTLELDEALEIYDDSSPMELYTAERWVPLEAPVTTDDLPPNTTYQDLPSGGFTDQSIVRSTVIANNMYFTNGDDEVLKYDGTNVYRAGLQYWAPQLFCNVDTTTPSIPQNTTTASATASGSTFTVALGAQAAFSVGDTVKSNLGYIYIVSTISSSGGSGTITVAAAIASSGSVTSVSLVNRFKYYFRLNAIDANGNIVAGAATGLDDYVIDMSATGQIKHKMVGLPAFDMYNYDSLDIEVYRTLAGSNGPYYRVGVVDLNFNNSMGYIEFTDATSDTFLSTLDPVNTALVGAEIGTLWSQPLRAKYVTSMNNKLVLMNVKGYPQLDAVLRADEGFGSLAVSALDNKTVLLRRDSTDTAPTTNMVDRVNFEFLDTRSGTVSSVNVGSYRFDVTTGAAHGLAAKDWVYLFYAATGNDQGLRFSGWYQVASVLSSTEFRVNANVAASADYPDSWVKATVASDVPVFISTDGNYAQIGGNVPNELTAIQRLAAAVNSVMRMTDVTLTGQTTFTPWISAAAGTTQGPGRIVFRQDLVESATFEVTLTTAITGASWYVDGSKRSASSEAQASTPIFPSRAIVSYENYPEIFYGPDLSNSPAVNVIDVNAADGEEITGGLPFFGASAFSASQQEQLLIIFKQNSIYAVDMNTGVSSKLRSRGLGCTAPHSIAPTRDGIMFANNSGVYKLDSGLNIVFAGLYIQNLYQDEINVDALSAATATHYAIGTTYKLSVPLVGNEKNSNVLVYNHQNEDEGPFGAWTEYTNHPATGWANLGANAYFATSTGSVFKVRNEGDSTDYRDDGEAVAEMVMLLRAEDFGTSGVRKVVPYVTSHFQLKDSSTTNTGIYVAYDLQSPFESAGTLNFVKGADTKVVFAEASMPRRKSNYMQIKYVNSTKDEGVILAGIDYTVSGLSHLGTQQVTERP